MTPIQKFNEENHLPHEDGTNNDYGRELIYDFDSSSMSQVSFMFKEFCASDNYYQSDHIFCHVHIKLFNSRLSGFYFFLGIFKQDYPELLKVRLIGHGLTHW